MSITAAQVKELRELTGAGMMECKKALEEAKGDMQAAIEAMRKAGLAKAAKKAGRVAAEGTVVIHSSNDRKMAAIAEINCETDFVGRDSNFKEFAQAVAQAVLASQVTELEQLNTVTLANGQQTVEQARQELINKLGENIQIRRVAILKTDGVIGEYSHGGRIGVIAALTGNDATLAKDIAMHIAASNPQAIKPEDVSQDLIAKEKEIYSAQAATSGKPADIIEKMVMGRINKFLAEISLVGQPFVKDPDQTVGKLLSAAKADVVAFVRYEVGEGIEKQVEDFAQAVMSQIGGAT